MMTFYFQKEGTVLKVKISGELDMEIASPLKEKLDAQLSSMDIRHLVFDFSNLDFIDSSGVGILISRYRQLVPIGGSVRVEKVKPNVYRILELSGIPKVMAVSQLKKGGERG